jgi:predicted DNA-binding protein
MKTAAMNIRIEPELLARFSRLAKLAGRPSAQLVRELMWRYVETTEEQEKRAASIAARLMDVATN